jgi:hypothetical protein
MGGSKIMKVYNITNARREASEITREVGYWRDNFWGAGFFSRADRRKL